MDNYFIKDDGTKLEVNENNLFDFINPTSKNTNYWDGPPLGKISDRQIGNSLLQISQLIHLLQNINTQNKKFLDVGTGDGAVPYIISKIMPFKQVLGIDPFSQQEHTSSLNFESYEASNAKILNKIFEKSTFDILYFKNILNFEHFYNIPREYNYSKLNKDTYYFRKIYETKLLEENEKFDIIYCKAIEHIHNWPEFFKNLSNLLSKEGILIIKHLSFFSYLGPHRYCSTFIPWGHLLLNETEYRRYLSEFHQERADLTYKRYIEDLTYPRTTVNELIRICDKNNLNLNYYQNEPLRFINKIQPKIKEIKNFWEMIQKNFPFLSNDEVLSGRYHLVFKKY